MKKVFIFAILVVLLVLTLGFRPYPLDYSASGMEQRIAELEARVDLLEGKTVTKRCGTCGKYIVIYPHK